MSIYKYTYIYNNEMTGYWRRCNERITEARTRGFVFTMTNMKWPSDTRLVMFGDNTVSWTSLVGDSEV